MQKSLICPEQRPSQWCPVDHTLLPSPQSARAALNIASSSTPLGKAASPAAAAAAAEVKDIIPLPSRDIEDEAGVVQRTSPFPQVLGGVIASWSSSESVPSTSIWSVLEEETLLIDLSPRSVIEEDERESLLEDDGREREPAPQWAWVGPQPAIWPAFASAEAE